MKILDSCWPLWAHLPSPFCTPEAGEPAAFGGVRKTSATWRWKHRGPNQIATVPVGPGTTQVTSLFYFKGIYRQLTFLYLSIRTQSHPKEKQKVDLFFISGFGLFLPLHRSLTKLIKHRFWSRTDSTLGPWANGFMSLNLQVQDNNSSFRR